MSKRQYAAEEKAAALAVLVSCRGVVKEAARLAGVPRRTLGYWSEGKGIDAGVKAMIEPAKKELADRFRDEAGAALEEAASKRKDASYHQLMVGAGISADKSQLLSGAPTHIIAEAAKENARQGFERLWELAQLRAAELGHTVTRPQLAAHIFKLKPEYRPLLADEFGDVPLTGE